MKTACAIGLVVLLLAGTSSSAEEKAARQLLRSGVERYRAFDYEGAADDLRRALVSSPAGDEKGTAAILRALGDVLVALGRDPEAAAAYRRLLDLETRRRAPKDPALNATRWSLYAMETALGRYEAAGRLFKDVADETPRAIVTTLVLVDGSDINKVTLLSGFPVKYSEALVRRGLRVHERVYGAEHAVAATARLAAVLRELHREDEASRLDARLRPVGDRAPAGH